MHHAELLRVKLDLVVVAVGGEHRASVEVAHLKWRIVSYSIVLHRIHTYLRVERRHSLAHCHLLITILLYSISQILQYSYTTTV